MRVKMSGDSKEPRVNAFPGAWWRGQQIAQEWRELILTLGALAGNVTHTFFGGGWRCAESNRVQPWTQSRAQHQAIPEIQAPVVSRGF